MHRLSSLARRAGIAVTLTLVASLAIATSGAQAVVVNDGGTVAGVALVPGTSSQLSAAGISAATSSASCSDPWLSSDLGGPLLPANGLCWRGGSVMHGNETFALTWDPNRSYWEITRGYVEKFLRDVASGSGTLTSPYAQTGQYHDGKGAAANRSLYGGGCIDYGNVGGSSCKFGSSTGSGAGYNYTQPAPGPKCTPNGTNQFYEDASGGWTVAPNNVCVTDAQIQAELQRTIPQEGLIGRTAPGYTPLVVVLTPPGVEVCLDGSEKLCSANRAPSSSAARFCSYHSQVQVTNSNGTTQDVAYVVQPWVASWPLNSGVNNGCDDPDMQDIQLSVTNQQLATDVGMRLVSPLSQGQLAAITNPGLNSWLASDGTEINDHGCLPEGSPSNPLDQVTVGTSSQNPYFLQREFNNAGVLESDPDALRCAPMVLLSPAFVVPSSVNIGDEVQLDGSSTTSSLMVPRSGYQWDFGDGTVAVGPSVVHTYTKAGTYGVKLTVTDRGGNVQSLSQTIVVFGPSGNPGGNTAGFHVALQLMPQALHSVLAHGLAVRVHSNEVANGIASISVSRRTAKRAHIKAGRARSVVLGKGTLSNVASGTVTLRLHLSAAIVKKLKHLRHVTLTVHFALVDATGGHVAIDAAGRY